VDGGAAGTTCHNTTCLHYYKLLTHDKYFNYAGKKTHLIVDEGYLCVAVCIKVQTTPIRFMVHSYHTATIPIAVLSPGRTVLRHSSRFDAYTVYTDHVTGRGYAKFHGICSTADVEVPDIVWGVLLYAQASRPVITDYAARPINTLNASDDIAVGLNHITISAKCFLWKCLGHVNPRKLDNMHKSVEGIPIISMPSDIDKCTTCWIFKIRRSDCGSQGTRQDTTVTGQGILMEWGFICYHSKTKDRY
jgi:hypothetical protein